MVKTYYNLELDQVYKEFQTNSSSGLSRDEANKRLEIYGYNEIPKAS
ncbi:MAG: cation-transporting P-type ATPase, partial [Candidatus Hodarchaeota archaeon]